MKRLLVIWLLLFYGLFLDGQTLKDTVQIREVRVFGQRKPQETGLRITRPDSMALINAITTNLAELLSANTPVFIKSYGRGSSATASFRGTSANHTRLTWNGMALNSPMRGSADLSLLPVMFTDDVWLLHGGSSLAEGTGALGGSIHLGNKPDWTSNTQASLLVERGSFNTGSYQFRLQAGKGRFRSVTRLVADHSDNNFPFYNVGVLPFRQDTLKNASYLKLGILQEFYYRSQPDKLSALRFWGQVSDRDLPQLMSYEGSERVEYQVDEQIRVQYEAKNYAARVKFHYFSGFNYTYLRYKRYMTDPWFVNDEAVSMENSLFNQLKMNADVSDKLHISGSFEMNYHWVLVNNEPRNTGYDENRLEAGGMVHARFRPANNWGLFALIRSEWYDNRLIPVIPSAGAEYITARPFPAMIRLNLARNYNKPSLNDLYWIPGGNPDLQAEDGITADLAFSTESRREGLWKNEVSLFYSLIDNWIIWQPAANGAWYWEAANVKKVFSRGVEYNFSSQAVVGKVKFRMAGNYAYTRSTNENAVSSIDQSRGKQLIYIPKHTGNLNMAATRGLWTLKGNVGYTGKRYTQSSNEWSHFESVLNPFWMTSLSLEKLWNLSHAMVLNTQVKAENLLDTDYQQILWRPMPGRHYSITMSLKRSK